MSTSEQISSNNYTPAVEAHLPKKSIELNAADKERLTNKIKQQLQQQNAVLITHYYAPTEVQALTDAARHGELKAKARSPR